MDANDVMKELSKNHTRPPVAALHAAVTLRSEVAPLMLKELKRLLATFDANLDAQRKGIQGQDETGGESALFFTDSSSRPNGSRRKPSGRSPNS